MTEHPSPAVAAAPETPPAYPPAIRTTTMPADTNPAGDIFGGWLMWQMDLAATSVANLRSRGRCVTAAVDGMAFIRAVHVGDEVSLYAECVSVGRTSMKITVEAWRRPRESDEMDKVTQATFVSVAVDDYGKPRPVDPPRPAPL
jgi:acyl-CoA thioesterase YciA